MIQIPKVNLSDGSEVSGSTQQLLFVKWGWVRVGIQEKETKVKKRVVRLCKTRDTTKLRKPTSYREMFPKTRVSFGSEISIFEVLWLCFARVGEVPVLFSSRGQLFWKVRDLITLFYVFYEMDVKIGQNNPPIPICVTVRWRSCSTFEIMDR